MKDVKPLLLPRDTEPGRIYRILSENVLVIRVEHPEKPHIPAFVRLDTGELINLFGRPTPLAWVLQDTQMENSDLSILNLVSKLEDGDKLTIHRIGDLIRFNGHLHDFYVFVKTLFNTPDGLLLGKIKIILGRNKHVGNQEEAISGSDSENTGRICHSDQERQNDSSENRRPEGGAN